MLKDSSLVAVGATEIVITPPGISSDFRYPCGLADLPFGKLLIGTFEPSDSFLVSSKSFHYSLPTTHLE